MNTATDLQQIPLLDEQVLEAIRALDDDGGNTLLQEILTAYFESSPALLDQLDEGLNQNDAPNARTAAHTLKSSSANVGAMQMSELCRRAESAARAGDLATTRVTCATIRQTYERTCEALQQSLETTRHA